MGLVNSYGGLSANWPLVSVFIITQSISKVTVNTKKRELDGASEEMQILFESWRYGGGHYYSGNFQLHHDLERFCLALIIAQSDNMYAAE